MLKLFRKRTGQVWRGVLAGLADKFSWNVSVLRWALVLLVAFSGRLGMGLLLTYLILGFVLPYREDWEAEQFGLGPRKIKEAESLSSEK
ncbi:TPA: PspC domain-containing protein [Streptococcus suis]